MRSGPGFDLIKPLEVYLTTLFCKLDLSGAPRDFFSIMKGYSLEKSMSIFTPNFLDKISS
jgi:hypothetical protein